MRTYLIGLLFVSSAFASLLDAQHSDKLLNYIQALADLVEDDIVAVLSVIEDEIKSLHPKAIIFRKNAYNAPSEYKFDESTDCVFDAFDLMDKLQPNVAKKLKLTFDEETNRKLFKAIESAIYILCKADDVDDQSLDSDDKIDAFFEWISMENKEKRANIETIIIDKMKMAFKLEISDKQRKKIEKNKHGQYLYTKCLKKLGANKIKSLYQQLRKTYPQQRYFMDMIPSIFMYSCSRSYATTEWIQEFMQRLVSMDDAHLFFNYMADKMEPCLEESADNDECIARAQREGLTYKMEVFLFEKHSDFKQYPVYNAINGLIEIGCAKKFVFEDDNLPDINDIPNAPEHLEL